MQDSPRQKATTQHDSDSDSDGPGWTNYDDDDSSGNMNDFIQRSMQGSLPTVRSVESMPSTSPVNAARSPEAAPTKDDNPFGPRVKKWGAARKPSVEEATPAAQPDNRDMRNVDDHQALEVRTVQPQQEQPQQEPYSNQQAADADADDEQTSHWHDFFSRREEKSCIVVPSELRESMSNLMSLLNRNADGWQGRDPALHAEIERLKSVWGLVLDIERSGQDSKPVFLFKDGPITSAVKRGQLLLIEDFDLPNQAVVERLNSLLEPSPSFSITEDITISPSDPEDTDQSQQSGPGQSVPILPSFQVFATVHAESPTAKINLSPATRSRFTEIYVQPYSREDLEKVVTSLLSAALPSRSAADTQRIHSAVELMFVLRDEVNNSLGADHESDIHKLFRMVYFVLNHDKSVDLVTRVWLAARFFYFDASKSEYQQELMENCLSTLRKRGNMEVCSDAVRAKIEHIFAAPTAVHGAFVLDDDTSNCNLRNVPLSSIMEPVTQQTGYESVYRLKYTGVCFKTQHDLDLGNATMASAPIQSFINQVARIFAAICTGCPLLLEGPPGTGKTAVVSQVARIVTGKDVARINFSANTSLEHLLGALVPRCVEGRRTFEWQDGKVVQATMAAIGRDQPCLPGGARWHSTVVSHAWRVYVKETWRDCPQQAASAVWSRC